jgi:DNA polymerase (family X)
MVSNREVSRLFSLYAELLLLHRQDEKLTVLLSGAAYRIRKMVDEISGLDKKELSKLFRSQIVTVIIKLQTKGTIEELDELIQLTPAGLFEMMRIRGLGGKKLSVLWQTAGIDSIDALLEACKSNRLSSIPGFGVKTQANIISAIESYRSHKDRFHYASIADSAIEMEKVLQRTFKTKLISLCGEARRQSTTVPGIELLAAIEKTKFEKLLPKQLMVIQSSKGDHTTGHTLDEIPVTIYHTSSNRFYGELFLRTGSEPHTQKVLKNISTKATYSSEESIYKKAGLPFVVPEMREDVAEWNFSKKNTGLLTGEDIKGVVHNHTTWSDGVDSLPDFVTACKAKGYEYVAISDHSKNAHYAGGLKEEKVLRQLKEIDVLNKMHSPFHIFKSIECDILVSGDLDFEDRILKLFDLVIVSVHQLLKMDEDKATRRLIRAIENPYTTILGHMTGRQLLIRPGYPVNYKKVIDACAANKVVIEVNANPYRLDMDWSQIPYALKKGVMISINPDAHSISEIDNIRWGVSAARKGGLTKDMTWNAMSLKEIEAWLKKWKIRGNNRKKDNKSLALLK